MACAGLMGFAAQGAIRISAVGDGSGYDLLGNATNEAAAYRSTGVGKSFDIDGDNAYGTAGLLMFSNGVGGINQQPFSLHTVGQPWATFTEGADFQSVAQSVEQGPMDDPTAAVSPAVPDWGSVGTAVTTSGGSGATRTILAFTISAKAPQRFRLGLVGGTQNHRDGRWDPTSYTVSAGTAEATVSGLENNANGLANLVFFDIDLNGATNRTFTISGTQRLATHGASLTGVTFDVPGPGGEFTPVKPAQRARSLPHTPPMPIQGNTLEEKIARTLIRGYLKNEVRLAAIDEELETLPHPYLREPTGTGGFLSHEIESPNGEVSLTFSWGQPVEIDAVALFPLRLFMDEIYGENLYWPGTVTINALIDDQLKVVGQRTGQPLIAQSLPELIEFAPVSTERLTIRCTDLPQHPHEKWHAAGFAEICIFSGAENVAPRAECTGGNSREGYHVLAREYLTDAQTPLGLPELSSGSDIHGFIKKMGVKGKTANLSYVITCTYPEEIPIDTVRIDPAIEHAYGQSFPVRFTIELLDARGRVVQTDSTYKDFPLRPPGLNPHFSHFPETTAKAVRLTVHEATQPVPKAIPAIAFSEITALYKGEAQARATGFDEKFRGKRLRLAPGDPRDTKAKQALAAANDGLTHIGQVLPMRQWINGLVRRQQLMEEQLLLQNRQEKTLANIGNTLIYGSLTLLLLVIGSAATFIVRNKLRMGREIRSARARMASDLHDDVGSNLGAIVLHVEKLQETQPEPAEYDRLHSILRLTRESVFGLREVLRTTAPEVGRAQDVIAHMRELAGLLLGKTDFTFRADPATNRLLQNDTSLCKGLLLFYKEGIHNAKTHSECSHIDISLHRKNDALVLEIKDNGRGITKEALVKPQTLRTLKQRADWLHADLEIESTPGEGTDLTLSIPKG